MHKICCNTTQNTRNQRVAKLNGVKYYTGQPFNRQPKGLHVNSTQMLFKILLELSDTSHTHWDLTLRRHRRCPIAAAIMSVAQLCSHLNSPMTQLVDIRYVCLVHLLLHDTAERSVNRIKVRWVQRP